MKLQKVSYLLTLLLSVCLLFTSCQNTSPQTNNSSVVSSSQQSISDDITYKGEDYTVLNNNIPEFSANELATKSYEKYAELDSLSRCGVAEACVGKDIMPTEDRGAIGQVKPTGWHTVKYDIVDGKYLYNRCHLIGFQLTGENANVKNLITGTRYFNVEGMLPFENMVADYVKETNNHVMYRVTPIYKGDNLVANGVKIEAFSVEDNGEGVSFNVFVHNVQPGIIIDYKTGESRLAGNDTENIPQKEESFVLNTSSKKFHKKSCAYAESISAANKREITATRDTVIKDGYSPCKNCNP